MSSRARAYSKPQTVGSGSVPLGRCQVVKRRVGSDARLRTIRPTTASGQSPGTSVLTNGAKSVQGGGETVQPSHQVRYTKATLETGALSARVMRVLVFASQWPLCLAHANANIGPGN
jgi:hypothetical protein